MLVAHSCREGPHSGPPATRRAPTESPRWGTRRESEDEDEDGGHGAASGGDEKRQSDPGAAQVDALAQGAKADGARDHKPQGLEQPEQRVEDGLVVGLDEGVEQAAHDGREAAAHGEDDHCCGNMSAPTRRLGTQTNDLPTESSTGVTETAIIRDPTVSATPDHRAIQRSLASGDMWSLVRQSVLRAGKTARLRIKFAVLRMVRR